MLKLDNIHAGYGRFLVVRGVGLTIPEGDFRLIIGPNGAGKTTLLRALFGLLTPTQGTITLRDREITGLPPDSYWISELHTHLSSQVFFLSLRCRTIWKWGCSRFPIPIRL